MIKLDAEKVVLNKERKTFKEISLFYNPLKEEGFDRHNVIFFPFDFYFYNELSLLFDFLKKDLREDYSFFIQKFIARDYETICSLLKIRKEGKDTIISYFECLYACLFDSFIVKNYMKCKKEEEIAKKLGEKEEFNTELKRIKTFTFSFLQILQDRYKDVSREGLEVSSLNSVLSCFNMKNYEISQAVVSFIKKFLIQRKCAEKKAQSILSTYSFQDIFGLLNKNESSLFAKKEVGRVSFVLGIMLLCLVSYEELCLEISFEVKNRTITDFFDYSFEHTKAVTDQRIISEKVLEHREEQFNVSTKGIYDTYFGKEISLNTGDLVYQTASSLAPVPLLYSYSDLICDSVMVIQGNQIDCQGSLQDIDAFYLRACEINGHVRLRLCVQKENESVFIAWVDLKDYIEMKEQGNVLSFKREK